MQTKVKKKILFIGEAATLAHLARPLVLAATLDRGCFDVSFACDPSCQWLLSDFSGSTFPLFSLGSAHFTAALARGKPLFDEATLSRYVDDDLKLLESLKPDAVIGDFRISLSISARLARVPYMAIGNCYWSPYWLPPHYPLPSLPLTRALPLPIADALLRPLRPMIYALHCRPMNRTRRKYGLPSLGSDLRRVFTDADHVLYADLPELFPGVKFPAHHQFIGPLIWSPPVPLPEWWQSLRADRPIIYVTMGSSGQSTLLPEILRSLASLDVTVIAATASGDAPLELPENARVANYLPGLDAARRARVIVCNGGSPTSQQGLAAGVPVIGIASNMDQFFNMEAIARAGAGITLRSDRFRAPDLEMAVRALLSENSYSNAARQLSRHFAEHSAAENFGPILTRFIGRNSSPPE